MFTLHHYHSLFSRKFQLFCLKKRWKNYPSGKAPRFAHGRIPQKRARCQAKTVDFVKNAPDFKFTGIFP
nr:MAG TPA: hypothetical protein [Caudoviricetes sp.]